MNRPSGGWISHKAMAEQVRALPRIKFMLCRAKQHPVGADAHIRPRVAEGAGVRWTPLSKA